jgi:hypothetical protein
MFLLGKYSWDPSQIMVICFSQTKTAKDIKIPSTFERAHLCDCMTLSKEISGAN